MNVDARKPQSLSASGDDANVAASDQTLANVAVRAC